MTLDPRAAVAANPSWYHTIELAPGVVTPGHVDWRGYAARVLPDDMSGLRALDAGTFDGFWAFEMERRGAEVAAIDLDTIDAVDLPPPQRARVEGDAQASGFEMGRGFRLAAEALGSSVERVACNVYDVEPGGIGGPVDLAFVGALLEHLRDPVGALEAVRGALNPGGRLVVVEGISLRGTILSPRAPVAAFRPMTSHFTWWRPNVAALLDYVRAAGFEDVRRNGGLLRPPVRRERRLTYCRVEARAPGG
jgi:tRNA (mo5U34)-methyltransferase